jgi:hypothetical protein
MRLIEHLTALGPANSEIAEELERIREEERWHQEEILDMLEENDPYALAYATSQPEVLIRQKNLWLEQQKSEWLARRRAVWEAKGKPISWDTWLDEREYEWATRELPDREAEWTRRLLEQDAHTRR